jgi:predicted LPLAT superfamily acyltransferase
LSEWSRSPERGAAWLVRLMLWLIRHMGWFATGVVLPGISAWFFVRSAAARAASREYLGVALGRTARARDVLRHIHVFARSILDRVLLLTRLASDYNLRVTGLEHVEALAASGRGGVLLGAHLGSFAVLRAMAAQCPVPVKMLMYRGNAGAFTHAIDQLDPSFAADIIPIGDMQSMLRVHEAVAAGALVGLLADRAPGRTRRVMVPFFGRPAAFPIGPFVLAASLGVPVLTFRGVRTGPNRYTVDFAPFADRVILGEHSRNADLSVWITRYATWLEAGCRAYPFNWFNFYPFWEPAADDPIKAGLGMGTARRDDADRRAPQSGPGRDAEHSPQRTGNGHAPAR